MADHILWRGSTAYYYRRIPEEALPYAGGKTHIRFTLKTKDEKTAIKKARALDDTIEDYFRSLVETKGGGNAEDKYKAAISAAKAFGFTYRPASALSYTNGKETPDVVSRLLTALKQEGKENAVAGILGGAQKPQVMLSDCFDRYFEFNKPARAGMGAQQIKKWINPRRRAMENLIEVVGDMPLERFSRENVLNFREWWAERIFGDEKSPNSGNKDLMHTKEILQGVATAALLDIDFDVHFHKMRFKEKEVSRLPYEVDFIRNVILKPGTLDGLNDEARMIVWAMIDTGCRNKELLALPDEIRLDEDIPHLIVRPNAIRPLKTRESERAIPLVGMALKAFQAFPKGFVHYRSGNLDNASGTISKYFRENGLCPTDRHSPYSFRHSFKDRLRAVDAGEEIIDALMGHKNPKPRYGTGYTLEAKRRWLEKIVFQALN